MFTGILAVRITTVVGEKRLAVFSADYSAAHEPHSTRFHLERSPHGANPLNLQLANRSHFNAPLAGRRDL